MALFLNGTRVQYGAAGRRRFGTIEDARPFAGTYTYMVRRENSTFADTVFFHNLITVDGIIRDHHPHVIRAQREREQLANAQAVVEEGEQQRPTGGVVPYNGTRIRFVTDAANRVTQDDIDRLFNENQEREILQPEAELLRRAQEREIERGAQRELIRREQERVDANLILAVDAQNKTTNDYSSELANKNRFLRFQLDNGILLRPFVRMSANGEFTLEHEDDQGRVWVNSFANKNVALVERTHDQNRVNWALRENLNRLIFRNPVLKKNRKKLRKKYKEMPFIESEDHYANKKFIA